MAQLLLKGRPHQFQQLNTHTAPSHSYVVIPTLLRTLTTPESLVASGNAVAVAQGAGSAASHAPQKGKGIHTSAIALRMVM